MTGGDPRARAEREALEAWKRPPPDAPPEAIRAAGGACTEATNGMKSSAVSMCAGGF